MAQFAKDATATPKAPVRTVTPVGHSVPQADTTTYEGGRGFGRDTESELFVLGASFLWGKVEFYEGADVRADRFIQLVHKADPAWLRGFIPYLRRHLNIRTAAVVAAAEYLRAGHPEARSVIRNTLTRLDEPAELVGYWQSRYGRRLPIALKRGVADALARLTNEYSALKYAGWGNKVSLADVVQLTHPVPKDATQRTLFQYLLAKRRGVPNVTPERGPEPAVEALEAEVAARVDAGDEAGATKARARLADARRRSSIQARVEYDDLTKHMARQYLMGLDAEQRRSIVLGEGTYPNVLEEAGATWEWVASTLLPGGMGRDEWEAVIPQMGVMALLRNLRNFEEAKISHAAVDQVAAKLGDAEEVRRSRVLPLRFLQAHDATSRVQWSAALERGLRHATANVPELGGKTIALADVSSSMGTYGVLDGRGGSAPWRTAIAFATVVADRSDEGALWVYGSGGIWGRSGPAQDRQTRLPVGDVLPTLDAARRAKCFGTGTQTVESILYAWEQDRDAKRIVLVTDEQAFGSSYGDWGEVTKIPVPIYTWNLAGYKQGWMPSGGQNRYTFAGLSDAAFQLIEALESGKDAVWPWAEGAA